MTAHQELERLLAKLRVCTADKGQHAIMDQISVLCRAYMEPDGLPRPPAGLTEHLTPNELAIVNVLHARKGQVVLKSALMDAMYYSRGGDEPNVKIADVMICKIRKRLKGSGLRIETIWARGYRMVDCEPGKENEPFRDGASNSGRFIPLGAHRGGHCYEAAA